jgi:hypothetical protein
MTETATLRRLAGALLALAVGVLLWPAALVGASVDVPATDAPVESTEPTGPPEETDGPATSEPVDSASATGEDDDSDGTVALIAVLGFVLLLVIASWWMVRRGDPDAQARPPAPDPDASPGSDLI